MEESSAIMLVSPSETEKTPQKPDPFEVTSDASDQETALFIKTLRSNGQVSETPGVLPPGTTHRVIRSSKHKPILVRKRFSTI